MKKKLLVISLLINGLFVLGGSLYIYNKGGIKQSIFNIAEEYRQIPQNYHYHHQIGKFQALPLPQNKIVMAGDSLIELGLWSELLDDPNIATRGISGATISEINSLLSQKLIPNNNQLLLLVGINNFWKRQKLLTIQSAMEALIVTIRQRNFKKVSIISLLPVFERQLLQRNSEISAFNHYLQDICLKQGFHFIDVYHKLTAPNQNRLDEKFSLDGVHLNGAGYEILAKTIKKSLGERP